MKEPVFLTVEFVSRLHDRSLHEYGGLAGLREPGLLDSAVAQAEATYFYRRGDLFEIAAAYAFHIAENQPYLDGNKRTAISAALTFLEINGHDIARFSGVKLYDAMIGVAEKRLNKTGLAQVFRELAQPS